jgi:hypothetical protein
MMTIAERMMLSGPRDHDCTTQPKYGPEADMTLVPSRSSQQLILFSRGAQQKSQMDSRLRVHDGRGSLPSVTLAKAGAHLTRLLLQTGWIPASAGMTGEDRKRPSWKLANRAGLAQILAARAHSVSARDPVVADVSRRILRHVDLTPYGIRALNSSGLIAMTNAISPPSASPTIVPAATPRQSILCSPGVISASQSHGNP